MYASFLAAASAILSRRNSGNLANMRGKLASMRSRIAQRVGHELKIVDRAIGAVGHIALVVTIRPGWRQGV